MRTRTQSGMPLLLILALLVACQHDPWANGFLTGQVRDADVAGTYAIDADSQKRTIRMPMSSAAFPISSSAKIVLAVDHSAEFVRVPEGHIDTGLAACSVTGHGTWQVGKNQIFTVVRARIVNEETDSACKGDFAYELDLYGKRPPYKLHITIGDPDSGDAVQFDKRQ